MRSTHLKIVQVNERLDGGHLSSRPLDPLLVLSLLIHVGRDCRGVDKTLEARGVERILDDASGMDGQEDLAVKGEMMDQSSSCRIRVPLIYSN